MAKGTLSFRIDDEMLAKLDRLAKAIDRPRSWVMRRLLATVRRGYALGGERFGRDTLYEERIPRGYRGRQP